jgi:membrane protease YdiL (CAAX protease family)
MGRRLLYLAAAPLAVVLPLLLWRNVFAVFALYHLGFCLLLPLVVNLAGRRRSPGDHLADLGLAGPGTRRGLARGLALGAALGGGTLLVFELLGDAFLADQSIGATLTAWGAGPERQAALFWFMVLANGPAEELYWRGFVHRELVPERDPWPTLLLVAAAYASYHAVTVQMLVGKAWVSGLFLVGIWGAGIGWGWLRLRTGSVWPPLLGHAGAVAGYMMVARPYLAV